jgi:hypothetical protein
VKHRSSVEWSSILGIIALSMTVVATVFAYQRLFPDAHETTFSSYEIAPGAMPLYAPKSAVDIRFRWMTESDAHWLSFRVPAADVATMLAACVRIERAALAYTQHAPPRWWPKALTNDGKRRDSRYAYYRCEQSAGTGTFDPQSFTAVDAPRGLVFEWRLD